MSINKPAFVGQVIYMTQQQVAERLGVAVGTLAYWRVLGGGRSPKFLKIGHRVLYAEHHVDEWALEQARSSTAEHWQIEQQRKAAAAHQPAALPEA